MFGSRSAMCSVSLPCGGCPLRALSRWPGAAAAGARGAGAQFSLWMHAEGVVTAAVQDGARIASTESGTLEQGTAAAQSLLRDGLGPNTAFVKLVPSQDASTVRFEASGTLPALLPWGPATTDPAARQREHDQGSIPSVMGWRRRDYAQAAVEAALMLPLILLLVLGVFAVGAVGRTDAALLAVTRKLRARRRPRRTRTKPPRTESRADNRSPTATGLWAPVSALTP